MALSIREIQQNLGNAFLAEQFIQEQGGSITIDGVQYTSGREAFSVASSRAIDQLEVLTPTNQTPLVDPVDTSTTTTTNDDDGDDGDDGSGYFKLYTQLLGQTEQILQQAQETRSQAAEEDTEEVFVPTLQQAGQLVPFMRDKGDLLQLYVNTWAETGSDKFALQAVRDSDEYETYFPGNIRIDPNTGQKAGIRYDESTYTAITDAYDRAFIESGLNPDVFRDAGVYGSLIAGDVGSKELSLRVREYRTAFVDNPIANSVKEYYSANYGIEMSDSALLASALDPSIGESIIQKRIDVAEIGAEASQRAFDITLEESERLYQLGVTGAKASQLFAQAEKLLGRVQVAAAQQGREAPTISQYIQSEVIGSPDAQQRIQNILAQQISESAVELGARKTQQGAVTGLTEQ